MNHTACIISSNPTDVQLRQLQNVFRILAKPEHKRREQALTLRKEISFAWRDQAIAGKWFPWPTTIAAPGTWQLKAVGWRPHGMLGFLGYHVGETKPLPRDIRSCILEYAFEYHLPPLDDLDYYLEWGEPRTAQRLKKLSNTLAALTRNAKRRAAVSYATAIDDWEGDLAFLYERFYANFRFGWPATDYLH
jgi:hypothetical protein